MSAIRSVPIFAVCAVILACETASALVTYEEFKPGETHPWSDRWKQQGQFQNLLKSQKTVGGHGWCASWYGTSARRKYFYQGSADALQRMIDRLDKLNYPHCRVVFTEHEGFWDNEFSGDSIPYDWSLSVFESDLYRKSVEGLDNEPYIVLTVHLGWRLDRKKLIVPDRLLNHPKISGEYRIHPDRPADARHAIVRAARQD